MSVAAAPSSAGRLASLFPAVEKTLPGGAAGWLRRARQEAIARFSESGFPTTRQEDWRFTPVDAIAAADLGLPEAGDAPGLEALRMAGLEAPVVAVFVDGVLRPGLSRLEGLPRGARLQSLASVLEAEPLALEGWLARAARDGHAFTALNTAFFRDGAVLRVPRGVSVEAPVHVAYLSSGRGAPSLCAARTLVVLEEGASASLVEEHCGDGVYLASAAFEAYLGAGARLSYAKLQRESAAAYHAGEVRVRQEAGSAFEGHFLSLGAKLARQDARVAIVGEGADCSLYGLYLAQDEQLMDFHTVIDHQVPHGSSRELFKGVLDGKARAVFNGLIEVQPNAQKTDAMVYNKNLLLSEQGLVHTKPEFKIHANDVQCKHGATIGQLSAEALFYLRSRGIAAEAARSLLVYGFAREMVDRLPDAALRAALADMLATRLREEA